MGFFRQEYWSGLPFSTPGDLPDPEIKPATSVFPALPGVFFTTELHGKPSLLDNKIVIWILVTIQQQQHHLWKLCRLSACPRALWQPLNKEHAK